MNLEGYKRDLMVHGLNQGQADVITEGLYAVLDCIGKFHAIVLRGLVQDGVLTPDQFARVTQAFMDEGG